MKHCFLRSLILLSLAPGLFYPGQVRANPTGEVVVSGGVSVEQLGSTMVVHQSTDRAIIQWQDFSIGHGEVTQFIQPSSTSAVLNRVVGENLSSIQGSLLANGQVYLINPHGVLVGDSGVVNTAGFTASALDVSNAQFLQGGDLTFFATGTGPGGSVVNLGKISALEGDVVLIARQVENRGEIHAPHGMAALAAGSEVLVKASGEERVFVQPAATGEGGSVTNSGAIQAAAAELKAAGGNEYALAINNSGTVRATGVERRGGRVFLSAGGKGGVSNSGKIAASRSDGGGGQVKITSGGSTANDGEIDAAGTSGGRVEIAAERAANTGMIRADGTQGAGGVVTVTTQAGYFDTLGAVISAQGTAQGGTIRVESTAPEARIYTSSTLDVSSSAGVGGTIVTTARKCM